MLIYRCLLNGFLRVMAEGRMRPATHLGLGQADSANCFVYIRSRSAAFGGYIGGATLHPLIRQGGLWERWELTYGSNTDRTGPLERLEFREQGGWLASANTGRDIIVFELIGDTTSHQIFDAMVTRQAGHSLPAGARSLDFDEVPADPLFEFDSNIQPLGLEEFNPIKWEDGQKVYLRNGLEVADLVRCKDGLLAKLGRSWIAYDESGHRASPSRSLSPSSHFDLMIKCNPAYTFTDALRHRASAAARLLDPRAAYAEPSDKDKEWVLNCLKDSGAHRLTQWLWWCLKTLSMPETTVVPDDEEI